MFYPNFMKVFAATTQGQNPSAPGAFTRVLLAHHEAGRRDLSAQRKFLFVAPNYFSKWVEVEAYASIKDKDVKRFVWKNIVCRFGIPQAIIADNGPQFDSSAFKDVVIPTEVGMPTARTVVQGKRNEDEELAKHLDWADKAREAASIRMAAYQQKVAAYYNRRVRPRIFKEGSLVLRKIFEDTAKK
ncbi:hypothetical protein CK203_018519 [Vitis vinifera]|uniref:Integrase catalytic domain-containing protein n=1 Tax=Vitis vinifera TaxID=29760 RepID=A0A438J5S7_VITVI|nr:hypothetical protein CK203_018519 [Vitis vinifera]